MEEQNLLQVGDEITKSSYGSIVTILTIDRVTPKRAFIGGVQLNRKVVEGLPLSEIGGYNSHFRYRRTTAEHKEKLRVKKMLAAIEYTDWESLPTDKLTQIFNLISNNQ